jgi:hypothetical protein
VGESAAEPVPSSLSAFGFGVLARRGRFLLQLRSLLFQRGGGCELLGGRLVRGVRACGELSRPRLVSLLLVPDQPVLGHIFADSLQGAQRRSRAGVPTHRLSVEHGDRPESDAVLVRPACSDGEPSVCAETRDGRSQQIAAAEHGS